MKTNLCRYFELSYLKELLSFKGNGFRFNYSVNEIVIIISEKRIFEL